MSGILIFGALMVALVAIWAGLAGDRMMNEKRKQYERLIDGYQAALVKLSVDPGNHSLNLETIKLRRQITRMEGPQGDLRLFDRRATTRG